MRLTEAFIIKQIWEFLTKKLNYDDSISVPAAIIAAFIPNCIYFLIPVIKAGQTFSIILAESFFAYLAFVISLLHIILVGFPLLYVFSRKSNITFFKMLFVGGLSGIAIPAIFGLLSSSSEHIGLAGGLFVLWQFRHGVISAFFYWCALLCMLSLKQKLREKCKTKKLNTP